MKRTSKSGMMLYGDFTLRVFDGAVSPQKLKFTWRRKNQIVNQGRDVVLALLAQTTAPIGDDFQQDPHANQIWSIAVGAGTTAPDPTDWCLGDQKWVSVLDPETERTIEYTPSKEIVIVKILPAGTLTGETISEAGLLTRGENDDPSLADWAPPNGAGKKRLYARQVHAAVTLTGTTIVTYEWRLGVTAQI